MLKSLLLASFWLAGSSLLFLRDEPTIETEPPVGSLYLFAGHEVDGNLTWEFEGFNSDPETSDSALLKVSAHAAEIGTWVSMMCQARLAIEDDAFLQAAPWLRRPEGVPFAAFPGSPNCVIDPVQVGNLLYSTLHPATPDQVKGGFIPLLIAGCEFPRSNWRLGAPGSQWTTLYANWWMESLAQTNLPDETEPDGSKATFSIQGLATRVMSFQAISFGWTSSELNTWFEAGGFEAAMAFGLTIDVQAIGALSPAIDPNSWPPVAPYPGFPNWGSGGPTPGWRLSNPMPIGVTPRPFELATAPWWTSPIPASLTNPGPVMQGRALSLRVNGFTGQSLATITFSDSSTAVVPVRFQGPSLVRLHIPTGAPLGTARVSSMTNDSGTSTFGAEIWNEFQIIP